MAQKSVLRQHAMYMPRPPLPRAVARSHARAMAATPAPRRAAQTPTAVGTMPARRATRQAALAGAILVCVLSCVFAGLALGLSALIQPALHDRIGESAFPLLLGGAILILARGQVNLDSYWRLRQRAGLVTGRWTDHALTALYLLVFFLGLATVAALLAGGGALLIAAFINL